MGWNTLRDTRTPLFSDFNEGLAGNAVYFVHGYYGLSKDTIATCDYIPL